MTRIATKQQKMHDAGATIRGTVFYLETNVSLSEFLFFFGFFFVRCLWHPDLQMSPDFLIPCCRLGAIRLSLRTELLSYQVRSKGSRIHRGNGAFVKDMESEQVVDGIAQAAKDVTLEATTSEMELKPIHLIVMVITLLHAVGIGLWFLVYLGGAKGTFL